MKILLITQSYLPVLGGLQRAVHHLAQGLHAQNHQVQVLTMRLPRNLPSSEQIDDIPVNRFFWAPRSENRLPWSQLFYSLGTEPMRRYRVRQFQQNFQPDVIHLHFPDRFNSLAVQLAQTYQVPLVVSFHGNDIHSIDQKSPEQQAHLRAVLERVETITAVSQSLLNEVIQFYSAGQAKGRVVYNGLPDMLFEPVEPYVQPQPYIFAYGRLVSKKGFDLLIQAFAQIYFQYLPMQLIIAGSGTYESKLKHLTTTLGMDNVIQFVGYQEQVDILPYIQGARFVVVPSREEPFGLVLLETMAQGRRVLATQVGGIPEIIQPADNLLVEPTVEGLKYGLQAWLGDTQFNSESQANIAHAEQFKVKQMVAHYLEIYRGTR